MPTGAMMAGGTRRGWSGAASPTASWPAATGAGRSPPDGHARNRAIAPLRAPVERTFAILKRWYGYRGVRYRSLVKKALQLLAVALNLRRALALTA